MCIIIIVKVNVLLFFFNMKRNIIRKYKPQQFVSKIGRWVCVAYYENECIKNTTNPTEKCCIVVLKMLLSVERFSLLFEIKTHLSCCCCWCRRTTHMKQDNFIIMYISIEYFCCCSSYFCFFFFIFNLSLVKSLIRSSYNLMGSFAVSFCKIFFACRLL